MREKKKTHGRTQKTKQGRLREFENIPGDGKKEDQSKLKRICMVYGKRGHVRN